MNKNKKEVPTTRNGMMGLMREGQENTTRVHDPLDYFYELCRSLDYQRPHRNFINYDKRGDLITLYMDLPEHIFYINIIGPKNDELGYLRDMYSERGFPKTDYYYRIGPYTFRLLTIDRLKSL